MRRVIKVSVRDGEGFLTRHLYNQCTNITSIFEDKFIMFMDDEGRMLYVVPTERVYEMWCEEDE